MPTGEVIRGWLGIWNSELGDPDALIEKARQGGATRGTGSDEAFYVEFNDDYVRIGSILTEKELRAAIARRHRTAPQITI